jgi:Mn2+/Fe2+ NRAMP family transporter
MQALVESSVNDKQQQDLAILVQAKANGRSATLAAYCKLSGPAWLQSAITLGGGSLTGALYLGVIGGTSMLWVQLVAMILGVIVLCAISYVTLSTQRSPFEAMKNDINPVLAWGWLIATMMANVIWALPQYSLAYSAVSQNLMPETFNDAGTGGKYLVSGIILGLVTATTLCYSTQGKGIKIYESILKIIVAAIVLCFMGVVIKIAGSAQGFSLSDIFQGFIPDLSTLTEPSDKYKILLNSIANVKVQQYWAEQIITYQRSTMIAATATAVGINMTFLLPYSMLNKGWNKEFRGLAIFDLSTGMVLPFVLAVSCVVIASSYMFHGKPYAGLFEHNDQTELKLTAIAQSALDKHRSKEQTFNQQEKQILNAALAYHESLYSTDGRAGVIAVVDHQVSDSEKLLAAMLIKRDTGAFATSLEQLTGDRSVANVVFGLGVLAMALSSISLLMLISGYAVCEMLGVAHGGKAHKIGVMLPALGIFWPAVWGHASGAFLAIVTSTIGYILFPIACLGFFLMMNSRRLLKDEMPSGVNRFIWNTLIIVSLVTTGLAAGWTALNKNIGDFPIGKIGLVSFCVLVVAGHFYMRAKHAKESNEESRKNFNTYNR